MRESTVIPGDVQEHFWSVVRGCIREFHPKQSSSALRKVPRLRKTIEQLPIEEMELFFHSEPFDVACGLAEHPLRVETVLQRYLQIRDEDQNSDH